MYVDQGLLGVEAELDVRDDPSLIWVQKGHLEGPVSVHLFSFQPFIVRQEEKNHLWSWEGARGDPGPGLQQDETRSSVSWPF